MAKPKKTPWRGNKFAPVAGERMWAWEKSPLSHLEGFQEYDKHLTEKKGYVRFAKLPPELRPIAEQMLHEMLKRYGPNPPGWRKGACVGHITTKLLYPYDPKVIKKLNGLRASWRAAYLRWLHTGSAIKKGSAKSPSRPKKNETGDDPLLPR